MDAYSMHTKLESSQTHISELLEMLALENYADESASVSYMMSSMGTILGKFSGNHIEIESEMNEMLESSRRGLLTHGEVAELIQNEATRSYCLSNILDGLKYQIENMHEVLLELRDSSKDNSSVEDIVEFRQTASTLTKKVDLILRSVDSMDRLVQAPVKKVQQAVAVIDSEVVMHVNKTQLGAGTSKTDAKEAEKEKERLKVEKAEKTAEKVAEKAAVVAAAKLVKQSTALNLQIPSATPSPKAGAQASTTGTFPGQPSHASSGGATATGVGVGGGGHAALASAQGVNTPTAVSPVPGLPAGRGGGGGVGAAAASAVTPKIAVTSKSVGIQANLARSPMNSSL